MNSVLSPSVEALVRKLETGIGKGRWKRGALMPSVREIARKQSVGYMTAWKAMQALQEAGLVASEPGRGCRVVSTKAMSTGAPIAVLAQIDRDPDHLGEFYRREMSALERAASPRGLSVVLITAENRDPEQMVKQALAARSAGLLVNSADQGLIDQAAATKLPVVVLDSWTPDLGLDSVMKDGQQGGILAVQHLASLGRKKIAWFGPDGMNVHSADRYGGYAVGLSWTGLRADPGLRVNSTTETRDKDARALLRRKNRPDGIVAMYHDYGLAIERAADELGLKIGKDLDLVGWCAAEMYDVIWAAGFKRGKPAPAITWSMEKVGQAAVTRLLERQAHPGLTPVRVKVPVELRK